jgi:TPR repeat protein/serine/threonine protein kinase
MSSIGVPPLAVGDVIGGRYLVESILGQGGMAIVYRARHTTTGRPCALKLVSPHLVSRRELVDLFVRESQVGARIGAHPNIVDVHDAGVDEARRLPFLAMELLEGETLEDFVDNRGPLPLPLLRIIVEQLADALEQAHRAGVVHRDLKPSNLFLTRDRRGQPLLKVMDFGIAKILEVEVQRTATQVGTPCYAAPEQMGGTLRRVAEKQGVVIAASISPATDVWAFGLLVFDLLTGLPSGHFWGVETLTELPAKVALEEAEPAMRRAGDRASLLPPEFDGWLARCLRRDASERWPSAAEAAASLLRILDQGTLSRAQTVLGAPSAGERGAAWPAHIGGPTPPHLGGTTPLPFGGASSPGSFPPALAVSTAKAPQPMGASWRPAGGPSAGASPTTPSPLGSSAWGGGAPTGYTEPSVVLGHARGPATPTPPGIGGASTRGAPRGRPVLLLPALTALLLLATGGALVGYRSHHNHELEATCAGSDQRCDEACAAGRKPSCVRLGALLEQGRSLPKDEARATELYQQACDGGELRGCASLGRAHLRGGGGVKNPRAAVALFTRACDGGDALGCSELAALHESGEGGALRDGAAAAKLHERACYGGELASCKALGRILAEGRAGLARDEARAIALYQRACDGELLSACNDLGLALASGRGGLPRDEARAASLYRRACDGAEPHACTNLALAYETGRGLARDEARAAALNQKACDGGDLLGCNNLALLHEGGRGGLAKDEARAAALYKQACDGGSLISCTNYGAMLEDGRGVLVRDEARAAALFQRACDGGELNGCRNLGDLYRSGRGVPKDELRAAVLLRSACDGGDMYACSGLGWFFENGHGGLPRDERRALDLYKRACEAGDGLGCTNYGVFSEAGRGGLPRDERAAVAAYEKGCEANYPAACASLGWLVFQGRGGATRDRPRGISLLQKGCDGGNAWGCDRLRDAGAR